MNVSDSPPVHAAEPPHGAPPATSTAQPTADSVDTASLDRSMVRGLGWTGATRLLAQATSWASMLVVANLLMPEDLGLIGMAMVFIGLTAQATEFGIGTAVIAKRDLSEHHVRQLHAVAVCFGLAAFLVGCLAAVPLAWFFRTPALAPVVLAMSLNFIVESFRTVPSAIFTRDLRFKELAVIDALRAIVAALVTVGLALAGARHWALVFGNIVAGLTIAVVFAVLLRQRFARPRLDELRASLLYSRKVLTSSLAWYGYSNADFVVAGRILGQAALGVYTQAWALASMPGEKIASMIGRVLPAMFSAASGDRAALRRYFTLATEGVALAVVPAATGLALIAPRFVPNVLGEQWTASVVPLQILSVHVAIHMLSTLLPPLLNMTGRAGDAARNSIYALIALPPTFLLLGWKFGATGIAAAWLMVYPLVLTHIFRKGFAVLDLRAREYFAHLWPALSSAAAMIAGVLLVRLALPADVAPAIARVGLPAAIAPHLLIAVDVLVGAAVYVAALFALHRPRLQALRTLAGGAKG